MSDCNADTVEYCFETTNPWPTGPCEPVEPCIPCAPVEPVRPCTPCGPCDPVGPVGPVAPVGPVGPVAPVGPTFEYTKDPNAVVPSPTLKASVSVTYPNSPIARIGFAEVQLASVSLRICICTATRLLLLRPMQL